MTEISPEEFKAVSKYIRDITGVRLDQSKTYLIETRLGSLLKEYDCVSYDELHYKARTDLTKSLQRKIISRITTNETLFFRDTGPFELLQHKIVPDLIDLRTTKSSGLFPVPIRIWSAACSTGQEIYSIAVVLKELLTDLKKYNIRLLGTDISDEAIAKASHGKYNKFEIERGLSKNRLHKYFTPHGDMWKIRDEIRALVSFKKFNLMRPLTELGKFDIVFCRNVAIYFGLEDRKKLFEKIAQVLEPDGYLIIGSTESLTGVHPGFEPKRHLRSIFYQLKV